MKRYVFSLLLAVLLAPAVCCAVAATPHRAIRVLLLDGESAGTYHDWQRTTPVLQRELEETGLFAVTVVHAPQTADGLAQFQPGFSDYQVVVSNYDAPDWPAPLRNQLEQFVSHGGGFVVVHAADNAFPGWPEFNRMIGVGGWRGRTTSAGPRWYVENGKLLSDDSPGSAGSHGARLPFQVTTVAKEHPIMKGLPAVWMHAPDELYASLRGPGQQMTVLATAHSDPANHGTGRDEPSLVVVHYGKGRVFHTMMGHDVAALSCVGFLTTFQRGTEWAATGRVTQKIPADFPTAKVVSYRADLAQMDPVVPVPASASFDTLADAALAAMRVRADELKIGGVAVVAYFEGDTLQSWRSKMAVVGRYKDEPTVADKGSNLLGIAYAKAAEMADTHRDSGSHVRPPMTGEFGWNGGVILRSKNGYVIAAFSGGKSEDDVEVSRAGVAQLKTGL